MKTILITGGNRGLGFATSQRLAGRGHRVVLTARDQAKGTAAVERIRAEAQREVDVEARVLDLASFVSVHAFAESWRESIDVLVHNAGMLFAPEQREMTRDGIEVVLQVNAVAPLLMTWLLREQLAAPRRVVAVGSSLHRPGSRGDEVDFRFDDPHLDGHYSVERAYKNSKLALFWVMRELELRIEGLRADVFSPGFIPETAAAGARTAFSGFMLRHVLTRMPFATPLPRAASAFADFILDDGLGPGPGAYWQHGEEAIPSEDARDEARAARFWAMASSWARL